MPSSKETRVRVEGFSKMSPSDLPASGLPASVGGWRLKAAPASRMRRSVVASSRSRSRKWRGANDPFAGWLTSGLFGRWPAGAHALEDVERLVDVALLDDERGQQPQHVIART